MDPDHKTSTSPRRRHAVFLLLIVAIIFAAIVRSSIATSLDSFTIDEAYHIGAGAAYVQTGDFRLNPEHPPLVKLWVGAYVSTLGYHLEPYRPLNDKASERAFVEENVFITNDPDVIQKRSRVAMFALNGLLLFLFAVAARHVFGGIIALAATAFLAVDPTVAAHFPVVMTDLPVTLLSGAAVLFAVSAFRSWAVADLVLAALTLGLALSTKHSAVITMAAVAIIGVVMAVAFAKGARAAVRLRRLGAVGLVLIGAMVVLWSFYLFRFAESPATPDQQFNRSMAEKISDVNSPAYKAGLNLMADWRIFPRAYTWGMADTIRAGAEGRLRNTFAFGRRYDKEPFYLVPGIIGVKLPVGLLLLTLIGGGLLIFRRIPHDFYVPLFGVLAFASMFLIVLATGSAYGGIRHALPIVPALALLAAVAVYTALRSMSLVLKGAVAVAVIGAMVSAVPVMRPWEYYNEIAGGPSGAYLYFSDEGVDAEMRVKELVSYYNEHLRTSGEIPYLMYPVHQPEKERRDLDWIGKDLGRDEEKLSNEVVTGTIFVGARRVARLPAFRDEVPIARFGNLFVFRGTFKFPEIRNTALTQRAMRKIYTAEPDTVGAIKLLVQALEVNPKQFSNAIELGNQYLKLGRREEATSAYAKAKEYAPAGGQIAALLERQIELLAAEPIERITPLRNPRVE